MTSAFRGGFTADTFRGRRERVLGALGDAAMVLPAAPLRYRSNDTEYPYRPDNELYYLTGFEEPEAVAVLAGHADEQRFVVFVRERDATAEQWSGRRLGVEAAGERLGADAAFAVSELEDRLPDLLHGASSVHYRLGRDPRSQALVLEALRWSRTRGARTGRGPRTVHDPGGILDGLRVRKDEAELACIRRATAATLAGFRDLAAMVRPGVGEWELQAAIEHRFRAEGAQGPAFGSIVASGENGCVLHYVANDRTAEAGDLILVDAGAEVDLYAADVTRTFPVGGRFSPEQRAVYDIVATALEAGVAACRPGEPVTAPHRAAVEVLVEGLCALGILEGSPEDHVEQESHKPFYPHQTSHWLGLDVHEPGDYAHAGTPRLLEPGMVLTVEPGLYFPPALEDAAGTFVGLGVRLEDDVHVTAQGPERLTAALPVDPAAIEALVGSESAL